MQPAIKKTRQILRQNPKRCTLGVGFVGVTILLCGRVLLNGPATAPASVIRTPTSNITAPASPQPNSAVLDWLAQPKRPLQRNLFASRLDSGLDTMEPANLELQTTVMEDPPRAMVNGRLVLEGDSIDGCTIVKIQPRKIFVQQDGSIIEVDMP